MFLFGVSKDESVKRLVSFFTCNNTMNVYTHWPYLVSYIHGSWFVPCRVFSELKRATRKPAKDFFVFWYDDFCHFPCVAFSHTVCGIFSWRRKVAKRRSAKITFRPARQRHDRWKVKTRHLYVVSLHGVAKVRHAKTRHVLSVVFFVFHFRMAGRQAKTRRTSHFVLSTFCLHAHMVGFKYTLCIAQTIRHKKIWLQHRTVYVM